MGIEPTCQVKIEEAVLRQASGLNGVRLWHMASVREYIFTQMEGSASFTSSESLRAFTREGQTPMSEDHKEQLESQFWNIANTLRGKMGADDFRDYILGLNPVFTNELAQLEFPVRAL